jgi:hypothetical protein
MTSPVAGTGAYIALPVDVDPDQLAADAIAYLAAQQPGWVAREGHLEVWLIRAFARMCAQVADVAAQVPLAVFQYFGQSLLGLPMLGGSPATVQSTWTMVDTAGYTIPAGTNVGFRTAAGSVVLFRTTAAVTVAPGQTATAAGAVTLQAVDSGTALNGLPAGQLVLVDNLSFVASVFAIATTSGGADPETQATYLNRLSDELQLLAPRPILPADFAALARNQPYVARACVLDGYNPANGTAGNARMVTVAAVDAAGNALSSANQAALAAALQAAREVNFIVNVVSPTYTTVNISAQVVARAGADLAAVSAACQAAVTAFLAPATWGGDTQLWANQPTVRVLTVGGVLSQVPGVAYVTGVQIAVGAGGYSPTDGQLPGAVPLPLPGAVNVTVQAGQ